MPCSEKRRAPSGRTGHRWGFMMRSQWGMEFANCLLWMVYNMLEPIFTWPTKCQPWMNQPRLRPCKIGRAKDLKSIIHHDVFGEYPPSHKPWFSKIRGWQRFHGPSEQLFAPGLPGFWGPQRWLPRNWRPVRVIPTATVRTRPPCPVSRKATWVYTWRGCYPWPIG